MRVVDDVGLPEPILRAIALDPYNKGDSDISVTGLIKPPMMRALESEYDALIEEPASGRIYALLGKAVHAILEMSQLEDGGRYIKERRFYTEEGGMRVSGQVDLIDLRDSTLHDFKVCSRWVGVFGAKEEWEQQLNLYRLLAHRAGVPVGRLKIHAIYRDWSQRDAERDRSYPQKQIETFEVNVWDIAKAERFLAERVHEHQQMDLRLKSASGSDELAGFACNPKERWERDEAWAVTKAGRKAAVRVCDSKSEAMAWIAKHQRPMEDLKIIHRKGTPTRCLKYCSVKKWCPFGSKL